MSNTRKNVIFSPIFPSLVYTVLSLLVLWGLLLPGYIFSLDMGFPPDINPLMVLAGQEKGVVSSISGILVMLLANLSRSIIPFWATQKIILFLSFFLAGMSAHRLCPTKSVTGKYFAGILYMLNPFTFVRYVNGQWLVLLGYAVTPFAVKQFINYFESEDNKTEVVKTALVLAVVGAISAHMFLLNIFILMVIYVFHFARSVKRKSSKTFFLKDLPYLLITLALTLVMNMYWIALELLVGMDVIANISFDDLTVFASRTWGTGSNLIFTLASMHGFWRPPEGYHYISEILPLWQAFYLVILYLAIRGFINFHNDKRIGIYLKALATAALISIILASGTTYPVSSEIFRFMFNNLVFFRGFREPQKFVSLLVLAYSVLGGMAVGNLFSRLEKQGPALKKKILLVFLLATPLIYSANMIAGIGGQPTLSWYPEEWSEVNDFLSSQQSDFNILFFPWHTYMYFSWSGRIIVNPAPSFFSNPVIQGKNIEAGLIETQSSEPIQHYIQFLLDHRNEIENLGSLLASLNVKYIILAKEVDYQSYEFLYEQQDLVIALDNAKMTVFKNEHEASKFYWVNETERTLSWEQFTDSLGAASPLSEPQSISYIQLSQVEYQIEVPFDNGYIIFTEPYDEGWTMDEGKSTMNTGLTNAFLIERSGTHRIYYQKFTILLLCYFVSASAFVACIVYLQKPKVMKGIGALMKTMNRTLSNRNKRPS